jgi:hypothetical protein
MQLKAFKQIYGTAKCKRLLEKDPYIKHAGGNDLGYKPGTNADAWNKGYACSRVLENVQQIPFN